METALTETHIKLQGLFCTDCPFRDERVFKLDGILTWHKCWLKNVIVQLGNWCVVRNDTKSLEEKHPGWN